MYVDRIQKTKTILSKPQLKRGQIVKPPLASLKEWQLWGKPYFHRSLKAWPFSSFLSIDPLFFQSRNNDIKQIVSIYLCMILSRPQAEKIDSLPF